MKFFAPNFIMNISDQSEYLTIAYLFMLYMGCKISIIEKTKRTPRDFYKSWWLLFVLELRFICFYRLFTTCYCLYTPSVAYRRRFGNLRYPWIFRMNIQFYYFPNLKLLNGFLSHFIYLPDDLRWHDLVWFYGISAIVNYLMPNPVYSSVIYC